MKTIYNAIVAMDQHGRIGRDGKLPWASPEDLKIFASRTRHSTILMGRKTFESLPQVLPFRHHIVLSSDERPTERTKSGRFVMFRNSVESAQKACESIGGNVWVIGGASIYDQFLSLCESVVVTHFDIISVPSPGDVYMPEGYLTMFPNAEPEANDYDLDIIRYWKGPTVEDKVIAQIKQRQVAGFLKYKTSMRRTDLSVHDWIQHAKEEMLDGAIYLQKLQDQLEHTDEKNLR
jgi:dihydrofolate reductase